MAPKESFELPNESPQQLPPIPDDLIDFTTMTATTVRPVHDFHQSPFLIFLFSFMRCKKLFPVLALLLTTLVHLLSPFTWNSVLLPRLFLLDLILFLDDPDPEVVILNAEGIARPSSVCLPYILIPGMDASSSAYQKAISILSKKPDAAAVLATLPIFDAKLSDSDSGTAISRF